MKRKYISLTTKDYWTNHKGVELCIGKWFWLSIGFKENTKLFIFQRLI
jgi:hypothetical protein